MFKNNKLITLVLFPNALLYIMFQKLSLQKYFISNFCQDLYSDWYIYISYIYWFSSSGQCDNINTTVLYIKWLHAISYCELKRVMRDDHEAVSTICCWLSGWNLLCDDKTHQGLIIGGRRGKGTGKPNMRLYTTSLPMSGTGTKIFSPQSTQQNSVMTDNKHRKGFIYGTKTHKNKHSLKKKFQATNNQHHHYVSNGAKQSTC